MPNAEVFPTPLVKQVFFEIRYPNLFFIEGRIGEFQVKVMKDFPQSDLVLRRNLMFFGNVEAPQAQESAKQQPSETTEKIWQFKSETGSRLEVTVRSLVLVSEKHMSYNEGENSFRSILQKTVSEFLGLIRLPVVQRVGLRYVNHCPLLDKTTKTFKDCYNSILPVDRFGLENLVQTNCVAVVNSENMRIQHVELLPFATPAGDVMVLDLDASTENVPSDQVVATADKLHNLIAGEFRNVIKDPIVEYMRGVKKT